MVPRSLKDEGRCDCMSKPSLQQRLSKSDSLQRPFELGWQRELVRKKAGSTAKVSYYISPDGRIHKSVTEISKYLAETKCGLCVHCFSFSGKAVAISRYKHHELVRTAGQSDFSGGSLKGYHTAHQREEKDMTAQQTLPEAPTGTGQTAEKEFPSKMEVPSQGSAPQEISISSDSPPLMVASIDREHSQAASSYPHERDSDQDCDMPPCDAGHVDAENSWYSAIPSRIWEYTEIREGVYWSFSVEEEESAYNEEEEEDAHFQEEEEEAAHIEKEAA